MSPFFVSDVVWVCCHRSFGIPELMRYVSFYAASQDASLMWEYPLPSPPLSGDSMGSHNGLAADIPQHNGNAQMTVMATVMRHFHHTCMEAER